MTTQFVHLHVHSEFSLVDSTVRLKTLVDQTKARGMGAVALTDMSNLFALVKMFKTTTAAGVKPIFGADVWLRHDERAHSLSRLVLLCQDDVGYLNLKRLISRSFQEGQVADRPTIAIEWLAGNCDGLLALSAALEGDVGQAIKAHNLKLAESYLDQWQQYFKPGAKIFPFHIIFKTPDKTHRGITITNMELILIFSYPFGKSRRGRKNHIIAA